MASWIFGTDGKDTLVGTAASENIQGRGDDDLLLGSSGNDILNGGEGRDTVSYERLGGPVTVTLGSNGTPRECHKARRGARLGRCHQSDGHAQ